MAGGQMMDIAAETASFDLPTVTRLQQLKTGALLAAGVEMGAILGRVPPKGARICAAMPAISAGLPDRGRPARYRRR
jgi:geranylgeranyl pyrophosphate synthase